MFELLHQHFSKHVSLNNEEKAIVQDLFRRRKYRKHQCVLQEGDTCRYESFIVKGCTKTYKADDKGQEHILQFGLENWWIGDLVSFLSGKPSEHNIDCLEDTEILQISKTNLDELYRLVPKTERYFRILIQNAYLAAMHRISSNLSKAAIERYQEFIKLYPYIGQRISNHQVASYQGITPQSLSRIRAQYLQK